MNGETHVSENDDLHQPQPRSQLFTVRLWRDTRQSSERAPYMQVKHVLSGETRYFSNWQPLIDYMLNKLDSSHRPQASP